MGALNSVKTDPPFRHIASQYYGRTKKRNEISKCKCIMNVVHHRGLSPRYVHCLWLMFSSQGVNGGHCIVRLWSAMYKAFSFGKKIKLSIVCWSYFENMAILYILSWLSTLFFSRFKCLFDVQINHCHCYIRWCPNNINGFFPSMILEWLFCHFISVRGIYSFFVCYFHGWKKGGRKQQHFPPKIHSTIWKYPTWSGSEIYASDAVNIFSN